MKIEGINGDSHEIAESQLSYFCHFAENVYIIGYFHINICHKIWEDKLYVTEAEKIRVVNALIKSLQAVNGIEDK